MKSGAPLGHAPHEALETYCALAEVHRIHCGSAPMATRSSKHSSLWFGGLGLATCGALVLWMWKSP